MGLLDKITTLWRRGSPEPTLQTVQHDRPNSTSITHKSEMVRDVEYIYEMLAVENDRRCVLQDIQFMLKNDPLVRETNARIARKATRGGFYVTVAGSGKHQSNQVATKGGKAGRGAKLANRAQEIIDDFMKRCKIEANSTMWIRRLVADGDLFLNIVIEQEVEERLISAVRWTPASIMKRNEDGYGQWVDPDRAFSEIDPLRGIFFSSVIPDNAERHFPLWAINHIRYDYNGGLYGNSQYETIRKLSKQNLTADDDIVVRRKTRAPMRRHHAIGTKDNPGDPKDVQQYKLEHQDQIINGKYSAVTDYYTNGLGSVTNLDGDGNLDKIADVKYLYHKENTATLVPMGLMGHAEDINRDVLDDQLEEYLDSIEDIRHLLEYGDGGDFSGLRAIIDLELLLHGIDVEATGLTYDIAWQPLRREDASAVISSTDQAVRAKFISHKTGVRKVAHYFDVENIDAEMEEIANPGASNVPVPADPAQVIDRGEEVTDGHHPVHDGQQDEEDAPQLRGMDSVEQECKEVWQERFQRIEKAMEKLDIPPPSEMQAADSDDPEEVKLFISKEDVDLFIKAVTRIQDDDTEEYKVELDSVYAQGGEVGGKYASGSVGLNFRLYRQDVLDDLSQESGKRIKEIDQTTLVRVREALEAGYAVGSKREMIYEVRQALGNVLADAYYNRAEMIARTESMWAFNRSALRIFSEAGVDVSTAPLLPAHPRCRCAYAVEDGKVIILVTRDERTCPTCKKFVGKQFGAA